MVTSAFQMSALLFLFGEVILLIKIIIVIVILNIVFVAAVAVGVARIDLLRRDADAHVDFRNRSADTGACVHLLSLRSNHGHLHLPILAIRTITILTCLALLPLPTFTLLRVIWFSTFTF